MSMINLLDSDPSFDHLKQYRSSFELSKSPSQFQRDHGQREVQSSRYRPSHGEVRYSGDPTGSFSRSTSGYGTDENYGRLGPRWHSMDVLEQSNSKSSDNQTDLRPYRGADSGRYLPSEEEPSPSYDQTWPRPQRSDHEEKQDSKGQLRSPSNLAGSKQYRSELNLRQSRGSAEKVGRPRLLSSRSVRPSNDKEQHRPTILPAYRSKARPGNETLPRRRRSAEQADISNKDKGSSPNSGRLEESRYTPVQKFIRTYSTQTDPKADARDPQEQSRYVKEYTQWRYSKENPRSPKSPTDQDFRQYRKPEERRRHPDPQNDPRSQRHHEEQPRFLKNQTGSMASYYDSPGSLRKSEEQSRFPSNETGSTSNYGSEGPPRKSEEQPRFPTNQTGPASSYDSPGPPRKAEKQLERIPSIVVSPSERVHAEDHVRSYETRTSVRAVDESRNFSGQTAPSPNLERNGLRTRSVDILPKSPSPHQTAPKPYQGNSHESYDHRTVEDRRHSEEPPRSTESRPCHEQWRHSDSSDQVQQTTNMSSFHDFQITRAKPDSNHSVELRYSKRSTSSDHQLDDQARPPSDRRDSVQRRLSEGSTNSDCLPVPSPNHGGLGQRSYSMDMLASSSFAGQGNSLEHRHSEEQPVSSDKVGDDFKQDQGEQAESSGLPSAPEDDLEFELLMAEGRKSQVLLLDERKLEFLIQPKLLSCDLLDLVASHYNLKEKEYCGLAFVDDTGHFNWLQLDRRVLEHDFPKKSGPLVLHFLVRFFIESIGYLRDRATVEVFYLQAKQNIYKGIIECDSETVFELAAHVLQATHGDFTYEDTAREDFKRLPLIPVRTLTEHPSLSYCEDEIITHYKKLAGLSRGSAIVNYMTICESCPTYGIHYYEVKDKSGLPWWLGLSYKGISQYDHCDKKVPRRVFAWKQLENLYFRDKKFSIEVHDPKRIIHALSSFNLYEEAIQEPLEEFDELSDAISDPTTQVSVSRRTFGPSNVNVYAWFTSTAALTKCIWSMAVSQHQFYLDRKQSKIQLPAVRSMSEIAADLSQSTPSLHSSAASDNISLGSTQSLSISNCSKLERKYSQLPPEEAAEYAAAKKEMFEALKARKAALEEKLKKKTEELRALCINEGELTGELPIETPLVPGEELPKFRKRVGTAFTLSPKIVSGDHQTEEEEEIGKLELEYELQKQISSAAHKLAQDKRMSKKVRKQRKEAYMKSSLKLKELEKKLNDLRRNIGRAALTAHSSVDESDAISQNSGSPAVHKKLLLNSHENTKVEIVELQRPNMLSNEHAPSTGSSLCSLSENISPQSPSKQQSRDSSPSPSRSHSGQTGYMPSSIYTTRTQYRNQMYPTFSTRQSVTSNQSDYDNMSYKGSKGELSQEDYNVYNISTNRTSRYDSEDSLQMTRIEPYVTPENPERTDYRYVCSDERLRTLPRDRHGSLDATYRRTNSNSSMDQKYGSLERNFSYSGQTAFMAEQPEYQAGQYEVDHTPADSESDLLSERERPLGDHEHWYETQESGVNTDNVPPEYSDRDRPPEYESSRAQFYIAENAPEYGQGDDHTPQEDNPIPHPYVGQNIGQFPQGQTFTTVHQYPSYKEESKPFEMSDFYKYSEKLRRQRSIERQHIEPPRRAKSPAPSHCSSSSSERAFVPHYAHSVPVMRKDTLSPQPDYAYTGSGTGPRGMCVPIEEQYQCGAPSPGPILTPSPQLAHVAPSPQIQMAHIPPSPQMTHRAGSPGPYMAGPPGRASPYQSPTPQRSQRLYQSPVPMKCEAVKDPSDLKRYPERLMSPQMYTLFRRCLSDKFHDLSMNSSFGPDPTGDNLADKFSEEMLAWYDDQGGQDPKNASFV
ncbi:uncharacterized protein LOC135490726 isoform X3 [Lineus longissimus]|uniref:uncharacterized protein LOC135490726 isoform X3 n=1 Tax=Lineus longissimus TaxID=88925 RepID=UPI00315DDD6D